jgi:pellino protein
MRLFAAAMLSGKKTTWIGERVNESYSAGDWTAEVVSYLSRNTPGNTYLPSPSTRAWSHGFQTAYQISCEALVKLGVADDIGAGALARENPKLLDPLPRWDDICVAVLWLAGQENHWAVHRQDHRRYSRPVITITSDHGVVLVDEELVPVLNALGLAKDGALTKAAEIVLWRNSWPWRQEMDVTRDPRFIQAVATACETIPAEIRAEMDRLVTITEEDVAKAFIRYNAMREQKRKEDEQKRKKDDRRVYKPLTVEQARRSLETFRAGQLDWLFFRRWRLADGWLSVKEAERALEIFHDSLAIKMRRAVVSRLYDGLVFAELGGG